MLFQDLGGLAKQTPRVPVFQRRSRPNPPSGEACRGDTLEGGTLEGGEQPWKPLLVFGEQKTTQESLTAPEVPQSPTHVPVNTTHTA